MNQGWSIALKWSKAGVWVGMRETKRVSAKIVFGGAGLGVPDGEMLKRRAFEVAKIEGRDLPNANDWSEARRELQGRETGVSFTGGGSGVAPESESLAVVQGEGSGVMGESWGEESRSPGEELVREGMEEAEHERMVLGHESGAGDAVLDGDSGVRSEEG